MAKHYWKNKEKNGRRHQLLWGAPDNPRNELNWSYYWRSGVATGFHIHFGDRFSETPFDFHVSLFGLAFFLSARTNRLGRLAQFLGGGHKRSISFLIHDRTIWWELWYDDAGGYDSYHDCDKRRTLPWWPFKNEKYRSWACWRDGNVALNPLDAMWGGRMYSYVDLEIVEDDIFTIGQFPNDTWLVNWKLQAGYKGRKSGPKWARRQKFVGYFAEWDAPNGIAFRNDSWKGDCVYGSAQKITDREHWLNQGRNSLWHRIMKDRERYRFNPDQFLEEVRGKVAAQGRTPEAEAENIMRAVRRARGDEKE